MGEISNNILAGILIVFIVINSLNILSNNTGFNSEKIFGKSTVGLAGLCITGNATINDPGNQTATTYKPFFLDVNSTPNENNIIYYDTFDLFNITTSHGYINFTADDDDIGYHYGYIRINDSCGNFMDEIYLKFTVNTDNRAPVLDYIPPQTANQNEQFNYDVNATDADGDPLTFGDNATFFDIDRNDGTISFVGNQEDVGLNTVLIYVFDDRNALDSQIVNFTIIDVNDAPVLDVIGSQTAIINYTFNLDVNATDVDTTLPHELTFYDNTSLFDINSSTGEISFTPTDDDNGTYWINISVTDGLLWDWEVVNFAVTPENRPPNITSWTPGNYELEIYEGDSIAFSITAEDPDGTIPSASWLMDSGVLMGETNYNYSYYASSGTAGYHNITVVVSDGDLTDSHEWQVLVRRREVSQPSTSSTSTGSGIPKAPCVENWRCMEWETCRVDGFQIRRCRDLNKCGTTFYKPETKRNCTYYPQPSCDDGIQNCHHGGCEILPDCGGPCPPCPTCSDGIRNQGEDGIDCGGPCPPCIEVQKPVTGVKEPEKKKWCGNGICEKGELFTCPNDCGSMLTEYTLVILVLFGILLTSMKFSESVMVHLMRLNRLFLMALGKKVAPVMTKHEKEGTEILVKLDRLKQELNKENYQKSFEELAVIMRKFFSSYAHISGEFTYIDLNEKINDMKISSDVKQKISNFSMGITKMEYGGYEFSMAETANMMTLAIAIVEKLTKMSTEKAKKIHKAVDTYNKQVSAEKETKPEKEEKKEEKILGFLPDIFGKESKQDEEKKIKEAEKEAEKELDEAIKAKPSEAIQETKPASEKSEEKDKQAKPEEKKAKKGKRGPFFFFGKGKKKKESKQDENKKEEKPPEKKKAEEEKQPEKEEKTVKEDSKTPEKKKDEKSDYSKMSFPEKKAEMSRLIGEGERLVRLENFKQAKEIYQKARSIYDHVMPEERKKLHEETIRLIQLYNQIISNL